MKKNLGQSKEKSYIMGMLNINRLLWFGNLTMDPGIQ